MGFLPDGEIEGYILGKAKIDLTKEKEKLKVLDDEIQKQGLVFKQTVENERKSIEKEKASDSQTAYLDNP